MTIVLGDNQYGKAETHVVRIIKTGSGGKTHEIKGQGISAFVTLKEGVAVIDALKEELKNHVTAKIGAIAKPDDIFFTPELPKTRSAKIMRRLLRDIADGRALEPEVFPRPGGEVYVCGMADLQPLPGNDAPAGTWTWSR